MQKIATVDFTRDNYREKEKMESRERDRVLGFRCVIVTA